MRDMIVSVQTAPTDGTESFIRRFGRPRRSVLLLVMLAVFCGAVWGQAPAGEDAPPDQSGAPAVIEGFRQARFGMNEEQVKQAIRKDFPEAAGKLAHYKIPRYVHVVDDFPMTVTGKVRKVEMRAEMIRLLGR